MEGASHSHVRERVSHHVGPERTPYRVDLPGVQEKDLDVKLTQNRLSISGRREQEKSEKDDTYYTYERSYGSFTRAFTLPEGVDGDKIRAELKEGDDVTIAITNIEQTTDELHGLGLLDYNINIVVDPGETKTVSFKAKKKGVYPYYCTNFCSALHQEMQGYMIVR